MLIRRFEEMEVWIESRKLVNLVYDLVAKGDLRSDFGLKDQFQRAAVSCMSNAAEGFDSDTKQQFIQLLGYTKRSASEVQSLGYVAVDRRYLSQVEFQSLYEQAELVRKLSNGFIKHLRSTR